MKNDFLKPAFGLQSKTFALAALVYLLLRAGVYANNVNVTNISLTGKNTSGSPHYTMVQFDISWENSFRVSTGSANWDAAWVFVKYRITVANGGDGLWKHASLNITGFTAPSGSTITPASDGTGAFIYRDADGTGNFSKTGIQLRWNYGNNGVADDAIVDINVYAIEMVYVPAGSYSVGLGAVVTNSGTFHKYPTETVYYLVSSENAITIGTATGNLYYPTNTNNLTGDRNGPIPDAFPKGYNAFYCMKYDISQQQYVDFLNSLTRTQQATRVATTVTAGTISVTNRYVMSNTPTLSVRNGIRCDGTIPSSDPITFYCDLSGNGTGGESNDGQWIACNWISWADVAAYLDWSGLRPMTELEFEKACRGTGTPVANEYAWGSSTPTLNTGITNSGQVNETSTNNGNCTYTGGVGAPMRVGAFATSTSTRITSGATYYGIMEMSGNLWKRPITVGSVAGRSFTGLHGDGTLNSNGQATVDYWPGINGNSTAGNPNLAYAGIIGVTSSPSTTWLGGAGFRGGAWAGASTGMPVSDRRSAIGATLTEHNDRSGGRGVRTAP